MTKKGRHVYEWPRPMLSADAVVFSFCRCGARLLLIRRRNEPFKGKWAIPGGYVGIDEEIEDAVVRELREETGLTGVRLEQMHTFGKCGRDPRGRQITVAFIGIAGQGHMRIEAGDDAAEARWFEIEKLPQDLAFDHSEVAALAIGKLKRKRIYRQNVRAGRNKRNQ